MQKCLQTLNLNLEGCNKGYGRLINSLVLSEFSLFRTKPASSHSCQRQCDWCDVICARNQEVPYRIRDLPVSQMLKHNTYKLNHPIFTFFLLWVFTVHLASAKLKWFVFNSDFDCFRLTGFGCNEHKLS